MIWVLIGAAMCGLMIGIWLHALLSFHRNLPFYQREVDERKKEMARTAYQLLNDPFVSEEGREEIIKIIRFHDLKFEDDEQDENPEQM